MEHTITRKHAPALGDIRTVERGDAILVHPDANQRADWGRYVDAISSAVSRGADVFWVSR